MIMGRTIPSFRIALAMEKAEWKPYRNALDKKDRKRSLTKCCLTSIDYYQEEWKFLYK
jgi:hypothetical protein